MKANRWRGTRGLAIAACLVMVLGTGMTVMAGAAAGHPVSPAATAAATTAKPVVTNAPVSPTYPKSPNPGTLEIYDDYGGAEMTSEDPAVAYDTISYEPILNVFETLITYNGSNSVGGTPSQYVPVVAVCVPGSSQCAKDYPSAGNDLIYNNAAGKPIYYTFVIDPAAQFYDQYTGHSWGVYPTDVMFSMAREMAWSESYGVGTTAGWLTTQALLPNGSSSWDSGLHAPYNTTPENILGSMLINDSNYCPAAAMTNAHGCITFNVSGGGAPWPYTLAMQLFADGFMSILPCAWYSANGANVAGWDSPYNGTSPDSSCLLPDGLKTTDNTAWSTYLASLSPTSWDAYEEELPSLYPAPNPAVQFNTVGSGPYYGIMDPSGSPPGYSLIANPAYNQPSGCNASSTFAQYGGYCWPARGTFQGNVAVYYESVDSYAINGYKTGAIDFGGILTSDTSEMLGLATDGKLQYFDVPTLSTYFLPFNFNWSLTTYTKDGFTTYGTPSIPANFFSGEAARALLTHAYEYTTSEDTQWTVDGVPYLYEAGGPIATGMNYYPSNVSYPTGNPVYSSSVVGSAGWWWHVGTTPGSGYYDPNLANCITTTCTFPIVGETGAPGLDGSIAAWISGIETATSNHVQPFTFDLPFSGVFPSLIYSQLATTPGAGPLPVWNLGWAADNFDPEDYLIPMALPNSTYTFSDAVEEQMALPAYDNVAVCGHSTYTLANLIYWAKQPELNNSCEGVAYGVVEPFFYNSTHQTNTTLRGIEYWAIQDILNSMGLYVWYGQSNQVTSFAPWIDAGTINTNPTVGGGGDQYWFKIGYVPYEVPVTFTDPGLPSGDTFTVHVGANGGPQTSNNSNGTISTSVLEPNATLSFSFTGPAGYAVSKVSGPKGTTTDSATVSTLKPATFKVTFVPVETLSFTETGLGPGQTWGATITWSGKGGPPNGNVLDATYTATTTSSTLTFANITSGSWKYVINVPNYYKVNSAKGSVSVKALTTKALKFTLVTAKITIAEKGLGKGAVWTGFSVEGATNLTVVCTYGGPKTSGTCLLIAGSYTIIANPVAGYTAPSPTPLTVVAGKGAKVTLTYT